MYLILNGSFECLRKLEYVQIIVTENLLSLRKVDAYLNSSCAC